jgi:hypothetical protein
VSDLRSGGSAKGKRQVIGFLMWAARGRNKPSRRPAPGIDVYNRGTGGGATDELRSETCTEMIALATVLYRMMSRFGSGMDGKERL